MVTLWVILASGSAMISGDFSFDNNIVVLVGFLVETPSLSSFVSAAQIVWFVSFEIIEKLLRIELGYTPLDRVTIWGCEGGELIVSFDYDLVRT